MSVKSRRHYDIERSIRDKIDTIRLVNRLQNHAFGEDELSQTQIRAAEILLKKVLPDLSESNITTTKREASDYSRAELIALLERADPANGGPGVPDQTEGGTEPNSVH